MVKTLPTHISAGLILTRVDRSLHSAGVLCVFICHNGHFVPGHRLVVPSFSVVLSVGLPSRVLFGKSFYTTLDLVQMSP